MIQYRKATKEDLPTIKNIAGRVIIENYASFLGEDVVTGYVESGMSDKEIDDGLDRCILQMCDGTIAGFAIMNGETLHLLMIDVPFQRKGLGTALLSYIEEIMFSNYTRICLQTFKENIPAIQFYLRHNWVLMGQETIPGLGQTMLLLEKTKTVG